MATNETAVAATTQGQEITYADGVTITWTGDPNGPRARRMYKDYDVLNGKLIQNFYYRDGECQNFELDPETVITDVEDMDGVTLGELAACHGLSQKLGDEAAVAAGDFSYEEVRENIASLVARLKGGNWKSERQSGGPSGSSILFKALLELKQKRKPQLSEEAAREEVRLFLAPLSQDHRTALQLRGPEDLLAIIKRLEAEKASKAPAIDTKNLMTGF